ncbi:tryptophan--tRNA ligase [Mycoplasma sp. SG1]|uniref:tryptophan--tRNA ligase n=1 Tax=Mycoplasma sp. SG1 TaxID=2810348 RepID=UPI0020252F14|nr:tryptophan--tRNA ligase [Mycoplasma sp. SG1]URM53164.1 tryptophan--tRNA ligase [Mycoplasma sp. SG1]
MLHNFNNSKKPIALTGITPTKHLTIGNYLGVIKEMVHEQKNYSYVIFIADLHSLTGYHPPKVLHDNRQIIAAMYLALGINPDDHIIFFQSENQDHAYLAWILATFSAVGNLQRMTQYKDKIAKLNKQKNQTLHIPSSLLFYPNLMASDILLYDPEYVFVGMDQIQHLEFTKGIIEQFNKTYETKVLKNFKVKISKTTAKIKSLTDPLKKMSKSDPNPNSSIFLLDDPKLAKDKILKSVTDSENKIYYDEKNKPGISNLLNIYSGFTDTPVAEIVDKYKNKNYYQFKLDLGIVIENFLIDLQKKYHQIFKSNQYKIILEKSKQISLSITNKKINEIKETMGLN